MQKHGPNNPRDWDPDSPLLRSPHAPHETSAVMRAHRNGFSAQWIGQQFRLRPHAIAKELRKAMDAETDAHRAGRPIYDGQTTKKIIPVRFLDQERKERGHDAA